MANRTLLIKKKDGTEIQIDIPEEWKVTFGPIVVGASKVEGRVPIALRIYETEKLQRAIFLDVESFRDMSIPIREKRVNIQSKDGFLEDLEGNRKRTTFEAKTSSWVNPDEDSEPANQLKMPSDSEMYSTGQSEE